MAELFCRHYPVTPIFAISNDETTKRIVRQREKQVIDLDSDSEIEFLREISRSQSTEKIIVNLMEVSENYLVSLKKAGFSIVNMVEGIEDKISDKVIDFTQRPDWMILHPIFAQWGRRKEVQRKVDSLLVCFGASDPLGVTTRVVRLLMEHPWKQKINVLTGVSFKYLSELKQLQSKSSRVVLFHDLAIEKVAEVMSESCLAVTAGGDMMYELVAVGTPTIVLCPSERQWRTSRPFRERNLIECLGVHQDIFDSEIAEKVAGLKQDFERRQWMSQKGRELMDGKGGLRVAGIVSEFWNIEPKSL